MTGAAFRDHHQSFPVLSCGGACVPGGARYSGTPALASPSTKIAWWAKPSSIRRTTES